ncbi:peptidase C39 family protein [Streptomyces sp. BI20]|uniref:peptidase C39 family protein n=1 Tax=Streptomyces sp. BI20 TaxID=3403460 RepID=UPI003C719A6C
MTAATPRRAVLAAALAAATAAGVPASAAGEPAPPPPVGAGGAPGGPRPTGVDHRFWYDRARLAAGEHRGTRVATVAGRPGIVIDRAVGRAPYTDPHTGRAETWEHAVWTSPAHRTDVAATELVASWNAEVPAGSWLTVELRPTYRDGVEGPWWTLGHWAEEDADIRRTSVDGQGDDRAAVSTDTLAVKDPAGPHRITHWRFRLTLRRRPGSAVTPVVRLVGAMASAVPNRFEVPASSPGKARELAVPRHSQEVHRGRYPEYDNGGEAWCSPTSCTMVLEYWGRRPDPARLAWVRPEYDDPQVCDAARRTYDLAYGGCGNWSFNAAYLASHRGLAAVVARFDSLAAAETLIAAGIPLITSQSFLAEELTGAGYGTAGHLMALVGFTADGDPVLNDPHAPTNPAVRRVYRRHEWETVWLRTKRRNAAGKTVSGGGGIAYVCVPDRPAPSQLRALRAVGLL